MPVSTWIEVDLDRFAANLAAIRSVAGGGDLLLVVKADAYGHGAVEIARAARDEGVAWVGVATLHEGIQLRDAGIGMPIVVLSPLLPSEVNEAVAHQLEPTLADRSLAQAFSEAVEPSGRPLRVHVEIDTGMGRTGVFEPDAEAFLTDLVKLPGLRLASVYTHFPDADADDVSFAEQQTARFRMLLERLVQSGIEPARLHASNSAGLLNVPAGRFDGVRVGLVAYGHVPPASRTPIALRPVMSFKSRLVQVRQLPAGASVSYGRTWVAERPSRIGVVAVGYGHGMSWLLSNRGRMLVRGMQVPVVGRVTMDLTMVDLTDLPVAEVGDEVVIFGSQSDTTLSLEQVAEWSDTLPYEVMCTIGKRVTRIYVRGGKPVKLTSLVGEREDWTRQAADHFRRRELAVQAARRS
jgi:alanine racemase